MNPRQLSSMGLDETFHRAAIRGIQSGHAAGEFSGKTSVKDRIKQVMAVPKMFVGDPHFGLLAKEIIEDAEYVAPEPCSHTIFGKVDQGTKDQIARVCKIPTAVAAAVMPDGHPCRGGLCVGGVVGLDNAVCPSFVGYDISCQMKMSVLDVPVKMLEKQSHIFEQAIEDGTCFGMGGVYKNPKYHPVLDMDWSITRITNQIKQKAHQQLGTSGTSNHFVDIGILTLAEDDLGLQAGEYVAIMSHSGSRGSGAEVAKTYDALARHQLSPRHKKELAEMAWLMMDTQEGQEYFAAMTLMSEYASANHDVIHKQVSKLIGAKIVESIENKHNLAFKEVHFGKELYVHRKGATPAGEGVIGIVPSSMATPAFVVRGKGEEKSLKSCSHGAGRAMSRTESKKRWTWGAVQKDLEKKGIKVLSAGADEVPFAYKDIFEVMEGQKDLVDIVARFDPKIVKMSDDGGRED